MPIKAGSISSWLNEPGGYKDQLNWASKTSVVGTYNGDPIMLSGAKVRVLNSYMALSRNELDHDSENPTRQVAHNGYRMCGIPK